jgi:hypothetical protein
MSREEENPYLVVALDNHILLDLLKPGLKGVRLGRCELLPDLDAPQLLPVTSCGLGFSGGSPGIVLGWGSCLINATSPHTTGKVLKRYSTAASQCQCKRKIGGKERGPGGKAAHAAGGKVEGLGY